MTAARKTRETAADGARPGEDGRVDAPDQELSGQLAERAKAEGPVADRARQAAGPG